MSQQDLTYLLDQFRQLYTQVQEMDERLQEVEASYGDQPLEISEENYACVAQLETKSGHSLYCTETGHHTTHRFSVEA